MQQIDEKIAIITNLETYIEDYETFERCIVFNPSEAGLFPHELALLITLDRAKIDSDMCPALEMCQLIKDKKKAIVSLEQRGFAEERLTTDELERLDNGKVNSIAHKAKINIISKKISDLISAIREQSSTTSLESYIDTKYIVPTEKGKKAIEKYTTEDIGILGLWSRYSKEAEEKYKDLSYEETQYIRKKYHEYVTGESIQDEIICCPIASNQTSSVEEKKTISSNSVESTDITQIETSNTETANEYVTIINKQKVFSSGRYVVGEDVEPGEYYFWGDIPYASNKRGYQQNDDGEKDFYLTVKKGQIIDAEDCFFTNIDNINYSYTKESILWPNHLYRCGKELPYGIYRFEKDTSKPELQRETESEVHIFEEYPHSRYDKQKYGSFAIDKNCKYVKLHNVKAWLVNETMVDSEYTRMQKQHYFLMEHRQFTIEEPGSDLIIKGNRFYFFVSIIDPIAEILIKDTYKDCEVIESPYKRDDTINYKFSVDKNDKEEICFVLYLLKTHKLGLPKIFNIQIIDIYQYAYNKSLPNYKDDEVVATLEKLAINDLTAFDERIYKKVKTTYPSILLTNLEALRTYTKGLTPEFDARYYCHTIKYEEEYLKKYQLRKLELGEKGLINSRWKSEFSLYVLMKSYYEDAVYQYHADWLGQQSIDIYLPSISTGVEYQGIQHFEAIDLFGGNAGLVRRQKLDIEKKEKCLANKIKLLEWDYHVEINDKNLKVLFKESNIKLPKKRQDFYENTIIGKEEVITKNPDFVIYQYDENGKYITSYNTITEACQEVGSKGVGKVINGAQKMAAGCYWKKVPFGTSTEDLDKSEIYQERKQSTGESRAVIQLDENRQVIRIFDSVSAASREIGVNAKSIRLCAKGAQKNAGGFCWKYADEVDE